MRAQPREVALLMGLVQDVPVGPVTCTFCAAAVACVQCGLHLLNTFFDHRAEARRRSVCDCFGQCRVCFQALLIVKCETSRSGS